MIVDINKYISYEIPLIKSSYDVELLMNEMYDLGIDWIGIQDELGQYKGLISINQVEELFEEQVSLEAVANDLLPYSVQSGFHFYEVIQMMGSKKVSLLPVFDEDQKYLGSITGKNIAHEIHSSLSIALEGSLIVLKLDDRDYSLIEISRIIENNDTKVYALFTERVQETSTLLVSLVLNRSVIDPLIRSLRRYNYDIVYTLHKGDLDDEMNDRWEEILKIINV